MFAGTVRPCRTFRLPISIGVALSARPSGNPSIQGLRLDLQLRRAFIVGDVDWTCSVGFAGTMMHGLIAPIRRASCGRRFRGRPYGARVT